MRQKIAVTLGVVMIAGGLAGGGLTVFVFDARADEPERSEAHAQMHAMMDSMMGTGASARMHAAMPGSEEMMEACAAGMGTMMNDEMMHDMDMDDMLNQPEGR
jgi:hypothetical protein